MVTTKPSTTRLSTKANTGATRLAATLIEFEAERRRRRRWARWLRRIRRAYRTVRWTVRLGRRGWHRRRPLLPPFLALGVLALTGLLSPAPQPGGTAAAIAAAAAAGTFWAGRPATAWWAGRGWSRFARRWSWTATVLWLAWLQLTLHVGLVGTPTPGLWLLITGGLWFVWWHHHVIPVVDELHEPVEEVDRDPRVEAWDTRVAAQNRALPGSHLADVADLPDIAGAWEGTIQGVHGVHDTEQIIAARAKVASAFDVVPDRVVIEPHDTNPSGSRARLLVLTDRNPAHEVREFGDDWLDYNKGTVSFSTFPDGERGRIRILRPMSGPSHELNSGDTGSGKSYGMSLGITQVAMTGFAWPIVCDPQDGQSLPAWAGIDGRAPWAAVGNEGDLEEILRVVRAIERAVNVRSRVLSRWEWEDEDGHLRRGLDYYDPQIIAATADHNGGFIPMIDWTLDEATEIFDLYPWVVGANERILRKARKAGIRARWATQYPSMDQLGKSAVIRQMLASGNVLAYANAVRFAGNMVLPSYMPNPAEIPKVLPNGEESMGMLIMNTPATNRPTYSRAALVRNKHAWADRAAEKIPQLDKWTENAFGDDYAGWQDRREARDRDMLYASPTVLEAVAEKVAPALGVVAPTNDAELGDQLAGSPAAARIKTFLAERGRQATTGVIAAGLDIKPGTVSQTCRRLVERGELEQPQRGLWALPSPTDDTEAAELAADTA